MDRANTSERSLADKSPQLAYTNHSALSTISPAEEKRPGSAVGKSSRTIIVKGKQELAVDSKRPPKPKPFDVGMEQRQQIFEDEIINRVQEIQKYAKALHQQVKKVQASNTLLSLEVAKDKDSWAALQ
jgi:hypothetical protein